MIDLWSVSLWTHVIPNCFFFSFCCTFSSSQDFWLLCKEGFGCWMSENQLWLRFIHSRACSVVPRAWMTVTCSLRSGVGLSLTPDIEQKKASETCFHSIISRWFTDSLLETVHLELCLSTPGMKIPPPPKNVMAPVCIRILFTSIYSIHVL